MDETAFPPLGRWRAVKRLWFDGGWGGFLAVHVDSGEEAIVEPRPAPEGLSDLEWQRRAGAPPWCVRILEVLPLPPGWPGAPGGGGEGVAIVREAVKGTPLENLVLEGPGVGGPRIRSAPFAFLTLAQVLAVAAQSARAASALHEAGGFAFLDPAQMVLASGGAVKIRKIFWNREAALRLPTRPFSPCSPPEDLEGGDLGIAHAAYSLGAVVFRLVSGRPPFDATDVPSLIAAMLQARDRAGPSGSCLADLAETRPGTPLPLADAVSRCTRRDPADRPATPADLIALWDGVRRRLS